MNAKANDTFSCPALLWDPFPHPVSPHTARLAASRIAQTLLFMFPHLSLLFRIVSYMMIISFLSCFVNPNNAWYSLFSTFFIVFVLYFYSLSTIHVFANKKLSETHSLFPWIFIAFFTFFLYNEKGYCEQQRKKDAERSPNGYITGYC